jgi:hypothetical protein
MSHLSVSNVVLHYLGDTRVVKEFIAVMNVEKYILQKRKRIKI